MHTGERQPGRRAQDQGHLCRKAYSRQFADTLGDRNLCVANSASETEKPA